MTFDWLIERGFDSGEYLALDVSSDGGSSWQTDVRRLSGNSSPEDTWISETVDLTPYASSELLIRFRTQVSRWNEDANVDNVKITGVSTSSAFPPTIDYPHFSDSSSLTLIGDASIAGGDLLRLTPAASGMEGAAWYTADKQFVSVGWETTFDFNLNENVGDFGGSDGFTFAIQNHDPAYLSGGGGTLGYLNLPNSLVVEFDTFQNGDQGDPGPSHISVHTNGTGPNDWDESFSLGSYNTPTLMDDGATHTVKIDYTPGILRVFYDDLTTPVITASVDLDQLLDLDAGKAWVGFTAATGGGYQNHDILNWDYTVLADTSSTVALSDASVLEGDSGSTDLVFMVTREGDVSGPATVDWSTADGTATGGVDYSAASGQVVFAPGESSQPIVVSVNGDIEEENHETLTVTDDDGATTSDTVTVVVEAAPVTPGPNLSHGQLASVGGSWQTVTLGKSYASMVVVATPRHATTMILDRASFVYPM